MKTKLATTLKIEGDLRRILIYIHDIAVTTAAFPISLLLRENFKVADRHIETLLYGSVVVLITAFFVFRLTGQDRRMWRYTSPHDLLSILRSVSLILGIFVLVMFLFDRLAGVPRSIIVIFWLVAIASLAGPRIVYGCLMAYIPMMRTQATDNLPNRVLVLGNLASAVTVVQKIRTLFPERFQIVGVLCENAEVGRVVHSVAILGSIENFEQVNSLLDAQGLSPNLVVVPDTFYAKPGLQKLARERNMQITTAALLEELDLPSDRRLDYQQLFRHHPKASPYLQVRRIVEMTIAICALAAVSPILLSVCLLNLVTMGTPILFTQCRAGRHMHEFFLLKFRTMHNVFDASGRILDDADRISPIGSFLRFTKLDELPQLWNIINGDMALIGPRPLLMRDLPKDLSTIRERYSVRPGLTGWAQVNGGQQLTSDQKMALDLYYIRNASFLLDMKILALTIPTILLGERVNRHAIEHAELSLAPR